MTYSIVVIDDEQLFLETIALFFADKSSYSIAKFNNPLNGLDYILENNQIIDLVLLDIMMPEISGLEILGIIKNDPNLSHIPVILQTAMDRYDIPKDKYSAADGYLTKPYTRASLVREVDRVLAIEHINPAC